jgi:hypothetical protein
MKHEPMEVNRGSGNIYRDLGKAKAKAETFHLHAQPI